MGPLQLRIRLLDVYYQGQIYLDRHQVPSRLGCVHYQCWRFMRLVRIFLFALGLTANISAAQESVNGIIATNDSKLSYRQRIWVGFGKGLRPEFDKKYPFPSKSTKDKSSPYTLSSFHLDDQIYSLKIDINDNNNDIKLSHETPPEVSLWVQDDAQKTTEIQIGLLDWNNISNCPDILIPLTSEGLFLGENQITGFTNSKNEASYWAVFKLSKTGKLIQDHLVILDNDKPIFESFNTEGGLKFARTSPGYKFVKPFYHSPIATPDSLLIASRASGLVWLLSRRNGDLIRKFNIFSIDEAEYAKKTQYGQFPLTQAYLQNYAILNIQSTPFGDFILVARALWKESELYIENLIKDAPVSPKERRKWLESEINKYTELLRLSWFRLDPINKQLSEMSAPLSMQFLKNFADQSGFEFDVNSKGEVIPMNSERNRGESNSDRYVKTQSVSPQTQVK